MPKKSYYEDHKITWKTPEFVQYAKGRGWKLVASLITLAAATLGYLYLSWTFSLAILTFAVVYYILDRKAPRLIDVVISDIGIMVGKRKYPYSKIQGFWVIYNPPYVSTLNLRIKGNALHDIKIQLAHQNPSEIREILLDKVPEYEGKEESLIDVLLSLLRI